MAEEAAAPRRRRKAARPQEIVAAALEVFAERGFAAARLDDVAARAGVSKGTLYLYFPGKEDLFKAVVRETLLPQLARLEAMGRAADGPVLPLLERFLAELGRVIATSRAGAIPKLVLAEAQNFPEIARFYVDEVIARGLGALGRLVERGIARGELRPVDVAATVPCLVAPLLLLALFRNSLEPFAPPDLLPAEAVVRAHLGLLRRGLGARPEDGRPDGG
jgi:AcrR family transcriptional regulator